eukprot:TRINITY_DN7321_c0_g1_i3.p1 TRINITY_DN7321_c0_g1~~TRINITY_DN7321_c0_g1_i3.p1  ORF type:complete len:456 (-),score=131.23 TRINITY_DN7321_c0_g1_i3:397-1725(-)
MSGVATKLLRRSRSMSFSHALPAGGSTSSLAQSASPSNPGTPLVVESRLKSASLRSLHCSILHPRAPKIRHLNASHALLIDLDKHIAKVQELEYKVSELEARIAEREALKQIPLQSDLSTSQTNRLSENLVSEEDRIAFQNRLNEARARAEQLAKKTNMEEANILSWHSKRLKQVLETLSKNHEEIAADSPKLLAAPELKDEENRIFDALNALVGMANEEAANNTTSDTHIQHLKNLVIERENLKLMLEGVRQKLFNASNTAYECQDSLQNMVATAAALRLQMKSSQAYLMASFLKEESSSPNSKNSAMWIYGPNPIFTGAARMQEISASLQNNAIEEALRKTQISEAVAEKNLAFAQSLVHKYKVRIERGKAKLAVAESEIDKHIALIGEAEDGERSAKIVEDVCKKSNAVVGKCVIDGGNDKENNWIHAAATEVPTRMND